MLEGFGGGMAVRAWAGVVGIGVCLGALIVPPADTVGCWVAPWLEHKVAGFEDSVVEVLDGVVESCRGSSSCWRLARGVMT